MSYWVDRLERMLCRYIRHRDLVPQRQLIEVMFADVVEDDVQAAGRVLEGAGLEVTGDCVADIAASALRSDKLTTNALDLGSAGVLVLLGFEMFACDHTGALEYLEILVGGVGDHLPGAVEHLGQGPDIGAEGVDEGDVGRAGLGVGPGDLDQGQVGPIRAFSMELGVQGISVDGQ